MLEHIIWNIIGPLFLKDEINECPAWNDNEEIDSIIFSGILYVVLPVLLRFPDLIYIFAIKKL